MFNETPTFTDVLNVSLDVGGSSKVQNFNFMVDDT